MLVTLTGIVRLEILPHEAKALSPIVTRDSGKVTAVMRECDARLAGSTVTPSPMVSRLILLVDMPPLVQHARAFQVSDETATPAKASAPMVVTPAGIVKLMMPVQLAKALLPMVVSPAGKSMPDKPLLP